MRSLFIKQKILKITDHYPVLDESGSAVYNVDQNFQLFGLSVEISNPSGQILCHIDRKIIALLPTFFLQFANGEEVVMRSRFTLFRQKIDISPDEFGIYIEGDILDYNFSVFRGGQMIGRINKKFLALSDTYHLEIFQEEFELLFVAIVVAIDHIKDAKQAAANSGSQ